MPEINLSNKAGRDAIVNMENVRAPLKVRWLDSRNRQARNVRVLKSTVEQDLAALLKLTSGLEYVGQALIDGDPEVDMERVGSFLNATSRVYVDSQKKIVHRIQQFEIVKDPSGKELERRPRSVAPQNVTGDLPLRWTGKFLKKELVVRRFVFSNKLQLMHINGLTFDFLYGMAQELEERDSMMLLGGGPQANQPLILRRGNSPYRGFLEGRTKGEEYCLLLHLSNLELKTPDQQMDEPQSESGEPT